MIFVNHISDEYSSLLIELVVLVVGVHTSTLSSRKHLLRKPSKNNIILVVLKVLVPVLIQVLSTNSPRSNSPRIAQVMVKVMVKVMAN